MPERTEEWFEAMEDKGHAEQERFARRRRRVIVNHGWGVEEGTEGEDPFVISICSKTTRGTITTYVGWDETVTHTIDDDF